MLRSVGSLRHRASTAWHAFAAGLSTPDLRRIQLAWVGSVLGNYSFVVALGVYAFREGGPTAVGVVGVLRLLPAAIAAPFLTALADRMRREHAMIASDLMRAGLMVAAGLVIAGGGPPAAVYALVVLNAIASTVF